jgi:hypothetical protein
MLRSVIGSFVTNVSKKKKTFDPSFKGQVSEVSEYGNDRLSRNVVNAYHTTVCEKETRNNQLQYRNFTIKKGSNCTIKVQEWHTSEKPYLDPISAEQIFTSPAVVTC